MINWFHFLKIYSYMCFLYDLTEHVHTYSGNSSVPYDNILLPTQNWMDQILWC